MLYHERMGPELTHQVWNLDDEDIDTDFPTIPGQLPSVDVNPAQGLRESMNSIIRWILLFLCLWSSFCVISDNALEILLEFLRAVFDSLATVIPSIGSFAALFPKSLHLLKKQLGIDKDEFMKYVVCPKCGTLYNFDDCYVLHHRKRVSKNCTFVEFPNHRQHFRRTECGEPLLLIIWFKVALSFVIIKYRRFITKDTDIFVLFINLFICISYCLSDINTPYLMRYHSSLGISSKFRQSNQQISVATF